MACNLQRAARLHESKPHEATQSHRPHAGGRSLYGGGSRSLYRRPPHRPTLAPEALVNLPLRPGSTCTAVRPPLAASCCAGRAAEAGADVDQTIAPQIDSDGNAWTDQTNASRQVRQGRDGKSLLDLRARCGRCVRHSEGRFHHIARQAHQPVPPHRGRGTLRVSRRELTQSMGPRKTRKEKAAAGRLSCRRRVKPIRGAAGFAGATLSIAAALDSRTTASARLIPYPALDSRTTASARLPYLAIAGSPAAGFALLGSEGADWLGATARKISG